MIGNLGETPTNDGHAVNDPINIGQGTIYNEWWAAWDRCCRATGFKPNGCQLIMADRLRREGRTAYSAIAEIELSSVG